jgi:hypothetical protein
MCCYMPLSQPRKPLLHVYFGGAAVGAPVYKAYRTLFDCDPDVPLTALALDTALILPYSVRIQYPHIPIYMPFSVSLVASVRY